VGLRAPQFAADISDLTDFLRGDSSFGRKEGLKVHVSVASILVLSALLLAQISFMTCA
jgi:hypothetical protein